MLIDKDRNILETAQTGIQQDFTTPPPDFLSNVDEDEPQIAVFPEANYVAAVIRLRAFNDTFLYVARLLDPRVVGAAASRPRPASPNMPRSNRAGSASRSRSR